MEDLHATSGFIGTRASRRPSPARAAGDEDVRVEGRLWRGRERPGFRSLAAVRDGRAPPSCARRRRHRRRRTSSFPVGTPESRSELRSSRHRRPSPSAAPGLHLRRARHQRRLETPPPAGGLAGGRRSRSTPSTPCRGRGPMDHLRFDRRTAEQQGRRPPAWRAARRRTRPSAKNVPSHRFRGTAALPSVMTRAGVCGQLRPAHPSSAPARRPPPRPRALATDRRSADGRGRRGVRMPAMTASPPRGRRGSASSQKNGVSPHGYALATAAHAAASLGAACSAGRGDAP